jgi:glutamate-1-semialdehyde 2,1-aminomutase
MNSTSPLILIADPSRFHCDESEIALVQRELSTFLPLDIFDAHAHLYDFAHLENTLKRQAESGAASRPVGFEKYSVQQRAWLGKLAPNDGLFFAFPAREVDVMAANDFVWREVQARPNSRGLLLIKPTDDASLIEARVLREGWVGFKVYSVYAPREDTAQAQIGEFLPEWAWEIAHRHGLCITLHMVRSRALADAENQKYINQFCRNYPGAKLILAHAARGFCAPHTVEGIRAIAGLSNVYFDTSAICEAPALEAILETFGPTRLLYGSDFPTSETRGRCVSLGDGFRWIYDGECESAAAKPVLIGIESLLALKRACVSQSLNESDIECIFKDNARELLGLSTPPPREQELYRQAKTLIPGGVQLLSKRPEMYAPQVWPPYFREARGCEVITLDGRRLLDFTTNGIGSCLLGYSHPAVTSAVLRRVRLGAMSTLNPPEEVELARELLGLHPWAQQVRFARAGGEALSIAVRIARAATGREAIAFCGYHGWHDWYLAANLAGGEALSGHLLPGLSPSGVPSALRGSALPFIYNDLEALQKIVGAQGDNLAAIVMEPTRNRPPQPGFLEGVRELCNQSGARLVFDEVTTGFRLSKSGVHLQYGVFPDLAVYAKALGNGHPIAAVIGAQSSMSAAQDSFISSTYWTESVGPTAALATLRVLAQIDVPAHVAMIGAQVQQGLNDIAQEFALPLKAGGYPALTSLAFDHEDGPSLMTLFTTKMLERGYLAGGGFSPTLAHTPELVEQYVSAARGVLGELTRVIETDSIAEELVAPVKHSGFARLN